MRTTEHAYSWEVDGLARRLESVEERLDRRERERLRNAAFLFWIVWAAGIGGLVAVAAQS